MRFEEVYDRWIEDRLTQREAADLLGVCERQFRRQCRRYESDGIDGLIDWRLGQMSTRRAPVDEVMRLVAQYRDRYVGWTVKHFYSKYREQKGRRSYNFVRLTLQREGVISKAKRRASAQTRAQAADRHDAASGRLAL
jgi:transposase